MRLLLTTLFLLAYSVNAEDATEKNLSCLELIENSGVQLGIKANAGGRAVLLRLKGGENVLLSNPSMWNQSVLPQMNRDSWLDFQGHIVWVGPQSKFWNREIKSNNSGRDSKWPPDPYLTCGDYRVVDKAKDRIVLEGPVSPLCGISLRKEYSIDAKGCVNLKTSATNHSEKDIYMNLWSNTRVSCNRKMYADTGGKMVRVMGDYWEPEETAGLPWRVEDGIFSFSIKEGRSLLKQKGMKKVFAKVMLQPEKGVLLAWGEKDVFVKSFPAVEAKDVDPEHAPVEAYQRIFKDSSGVLELEFHGKYCTLSPKKSISIEEKWRIVVPEKNSDKKNILASLLH